MTEVATYRAEDEKLLRYGNVVLSLGSCFSENIGRRLRHLGYDIKVNPFGTLYNPLSIAAALGRMLSTDFSFTSDDLLFWDDRYISLMHHSRYDGESADSVLEELNAELLEGRQYLQKGDLLLLTFGSAHAYRFRETGEVVANCHKLPANRFDLRLCSLEELQSAMEELLQKLFQINPCIRLLLTVSPIRYLAYGPHHCRLSKARLLLLTEYLEGLFPERIGYFPAYEILQDELRDYRFYADDLIHPSALAERIIFEKFLAAYAAPEQEEARRAAQKLRSFSQHRTTGEKEGSRHLQKLREMMSAKAYLFPDSQALERILEP